MLVASVGGVASADVVSNDSDPDGDLNASSLTVLAPAAVGAGGAVGGGGGGTVLEYTPAAAGYDALVCVVCDEAGQCSAAELVVAVLADG